MRTSARSGSSSIGFGERRARRAAFFIEHDVRAEHAAAGAARHALAGDRTASIGTGLAASGACSSFGAIAAVQLDGRGVLPAAWCSPSMFCVITARSFPARSSFASATVRRVRLHRFVRDAALRRGKSGRILPAYALVKYVWLKIVSAGISILLPVVDAVACCG